MLIEEKNSQGRSIISRARKKKKKILVSVITVCRNSEKTIAKTIESVLHQSYSHLEYLIIDGASTDRTMEIVKHYEPKFKGRLHWLSEKDAGIYHAMNKGIALSNGEIIGIINSDDWYEPESVQIAVSTIGNNDSVIAYGILRFVKNGMELMLRRNSHHYLQEFTIQHPACFVHKKIYQTYGLFDTQYQCAADYEFMLRLKLAHIEFIPINNIIANFQMEGISVKMSDKAYIETLHIRHKYHLIPKSEVYRNLIRVRMRNILHLSKKV
jgi:glycosyltransferase involved in cell wall biosynthesis